MASTQKKSKKPSFLAFFLILILLFGGIQFLTRYPIDALMGERTSDSVNTEVGSSGKEISQVSNTNEKPNLLQRIIPKSFKRTTPQPPPVNISFDDEFAIYYAKLSPAERQIYAEMYHAIETAAPEVKLSKYAEFETIKSISKAIYYDQPQFFWWENQYTYQTTSLGNHKSASISFNYNDLAKNLKYHKRLFDSETENLLVMARALNSVEEQELFIHDAIASNTDYQLNSPNNQTAYSAIVSRASVCAGYARAFQYLMQQLGVPTYYVTGKGLKEPENANATWENHAWNIVKLDGKYYNVDTTWDNLDPNTFDGHAKRLPIYRYFNRSDAFFDSHKHMRNSSLDSSEPSLPSCNATDSAFENLFGENYSSSSLAEEFGITEKDTINSLDEYISVTYDKLSKSPEKVTKFYLVLNNEKVKTAINNMSSNDRMKGYVNRLFSGRYARYTKYSLTSTIIEISEGVYLFEATHEFK